MRHQAVLLTMFALAVRSVGSLDVGAAVPRAERARTLSATDQCALSSLLR